MGKSYDINSKSDMDKLMRDMEKQLREKSVSALGQKKYEVTCPHCGAVVQVPPEKSNCTRCGNQIDLTLDIKF